jgi:hypothetical protein
MTTLQRLRLGNALKILSRALTNGGWNWIDRALCEKCQDAVREEKA